MNLESVLCPLYIRRFRRHKFASILCQGNPGTHCLISSSLEEREQKIEKLCNDYFEDCELYKNHQQNNKKV
jgi:hypothetical protein